MSLSVTKTYAIDQENWLAIMELGRYAPTPHNTQWYFIHPTDDTNAKVGVDETIRLPHTDPDDQFRFTGLGVFVRHLELASEAVGFSLETSFNNNNEKYSVSVRIVAKTQPNAELAKLIKQRRTSRLAYKKERISDEAINALISMTDTRNSVHISTAPEKVNSVLNLNNEVLLNDLEDKGVGDELNRWIRYSKNHLQGIARALPLKH